MTTASRAVSLLALAAVFFLGLGFQSEASGQISVLDRWHIGKAGPRRVVEAIDHLERIFNVRELTSLVGG